MMKTYKSYVGNPKFPEGYIAEQYLMDEAMKYCMEYIPSSKREIHKQEEKAALDDKTECGYPIDKKGKDYLLPKFAIPPKHEMGFEKVKKYETYLQSFKSRCKSRRVIASSEKEMEYIPWLRKQLQKEKESKFKMLADGPSFIAKNTNEDDEPFILASEAAQVFYCKDLSRDNWHVVLHAPKRLNHDVDVYEDPLVFEAMANSDGLASALMGDIDGVEV
ncbi:hypothetical protein IFM89_006352 [Coptis chinensis]|uniref:DUF4216 domain-containing protein n=1 Tax=Coptis chinensis TaxID=261450 RepID=A0A835LR27_9MAGN|nr:hypothetical protein IFM89_006352 [Coptis chinensis]